MERTQSDRKQTPVVAWKPRKSRQGQLSYDLQEWPAEPEITGSRLLVDDVVLLAWNMLEAQLGEERRRQLQERGIRFIVFRVGVRGQGWGQNLGQEMSQTLEQASKRLLEQATAVHSGYKVRQRKVLVSCCLAPNKDVAEEILAQLELLEDNKWGEYLPAPLTDETVTQKLPQEQPKPEKAGRPAAPTGGLARIFGLVKRLNAVLPDADYAQAVQSLDALLHGCRSAAAEWFGPVLERELRAKVLIWQQESQKQDLDLEQKKQLSAWVNDELRGRGLAIQHEGQPCRLVIDTHTRYPGVGRFRLNPIGTHQKTTPCKTIEDLLPFALMEAPPRDEPLARWRDRVAGAKSSSPNIHPS